MTQESVQSIQQHRQHKQLLGYHVDTPITIKVKAKP